MTLHPSLTAGFPCADIYDGGVLSQGRLCLLLPSQPDAVTDLELLRALRDDGVDLDRFYACAYETAASTGGWLPVLRDVTDIDDVGLSPRALLPLSAEEVDGLVGAVSPRIDVKLMRRQTECVEALTADAAAVPCGHLPVGGYHAIGVVNTKNQANVGERSALVCLMG